MSRRTIASVVFFASLSVGAPLHAQRAVDPSGHWEGKLQTPAGRLSIEIDLAKNPGGALMGSIGIKEENLKGLPLQGVKVEGHGHGHPGSDDRAADVQESRLLILDRRNF